MKNLSYKLARIVSILFVPPSFTIIIFTLLAFKFEHDLQHKLIVISSSFLFGFIFPIAIFIRFRKKGLIEGIDARIKEERTLPFLLAAIFYMVGFVILLTYNVSIISIALWFCYISNTFLTIIINKFWKISAHMMGASGPFAALLFVFGSLSLFYIILFVIIGWSRIKLECHNLSQVFAGAIIAFISTYSQIYLIIKYFGYA